LFSVSSVLLTTSTEPFEMLMEKCCSNEHRTWSHLTVTHSHTLQSFPNIVTIPLHIKSSGNITKLTG